WATHGAPTEENAHPHRDCHGTVVVVHSAMIENYEELKKQLETEGHRFRTETDTEVIAHLIEHYLNGSSARFETGNRSLESRIPVSEIQTQTEGASSSDPSTLSPKPDPAAHGRETLPASIRGTTLEEAVRAGVRRLTG